MASAVLIAAVTILAIAAHGDFTAPPRYDGAGYTVLARSLMKDMDIARSIIPTGRVMPIFPLVIPLFLPCSGESQATRPSRPMSLPVCAPWRLPWRPGGGFGGFTAGMWRWCSGWHSR
jgi:hypothetical protein